jgi:carbonic anhydrase
MSCCEFHAPSRRRFLNTIALGAGVGLMSGLAPRAAQARGHTEMLLLSCMDYRLMHKVDEYMGARGLREKFDHVVLAGASLGALTDKYPAWGETFWGHLDVAIKLHDIHRVLILDHRDCGAYRVLLGEHTVKDTAIELKTHVSQLYALRTQIVGRHPRMEVELGLMDLQGVVTQIV